MKKQKPAVKKGNIGEIRAACKRFGLELESVPYAKLGNLKFSIASSSRHKLPGRPSFYWHWNKASKLLRVNPPKVNFTLLLGRAHGKNHYFLLSEQRIQELRKLMAAKRNKIPMQITVNLSLMPCVTQQSGDLPKIVERDANFRAKARLLNDCEIAAKELARWTEATRTVSKIPYTSR